MGNQPTRLLSPEQHAAFDADGVVKVDRAIDQAWIDRLRSVAEREFANPGQWVADSDPGAATNRLFTSRCLWPHDETIRDFVFGSGVAGLVAELLDSESLRLYFDPTLVAEPGTTAVTPWHHDIPLWPFLDRQIGSAWVALTPATVEESSPEFVRGSHE
jgi:ectoine hydroxylase-related dioxygenase (phytanoyl-CoA dioxygenase family)